MPKSHEPIAACSSHGNPRAMHTCHTSHTGGLKEEEEGRSGRHRLQQPRQPDGNLRAMHARAMHTGDARTLKMLAANAWTTAISAWPCRAARTDAYRLGNDVPAAPSVSPMTVCVKLIMHPSWSMAAVIKEPSTTSQAREISSVSGYKCSALRTSRCDLR